MEDNFTATLRAVLADSEAREVPTPTPRDARLAGLDRKVDTIVGMRRVGKSWLMLRTMRELLDRGVPRSRMLYLEFEDERLAGMATQDLQHVDETFHAMHPESAGKECWYFFDEIQNVSGWEKYVRRLLAEPRLHIAITGSSARLLSSEIATSLRGRALTTELMPFSFREALRHRGIEEPSRWPPPARTRARLRHECERYLECGGFPEVQSLDAEHRRRILQGYLDVVILRDVVERHAVGNVALLRALVRRLLRCMSGRVSVNSMAQDLKSQGFAFGKDVLYELMQYVEDAFLAFQLPLHVQSEKRRQVNPKKVYAVDHGLVRACVASASTDLGHHLENIVYLHLRRTGEVLGFHLTESLREVDFVVDRQGKLALVQACASVATPATRERELTALGEAMSETGIRDATIVTWDEAGIAEANGRTVRIAPAWQWLLEAV